EEKWIRLSSTSVLRIQLMLAYLPLHLQNTSPQFEASQALNEPVLAQLRRFEHFRAPKWLRLLRPTPKGRHYSGIGGMGPAVILGGGWAGNSSFSFSSKRLSSGSGSV